MSDSAISPGSGVVDRITVAERPGSAAREDSKGQGVARAEGIPLKITGYIQPEIESQAASLGFGSWDSKAMTMTFPHTCGGLCDFDIFLYSSHAHLAKRIEDVGMPATLLEEGERRQVRVFPKVIKTSESIALVMPEALRNHIDTMDFSDTTIEIRYTD